MLLPLTILPQMIRTNHVITDLGSVPREWVFEHYLQLPEHLQGQETRITSLWNPGEKVPSMYVYFVKGTGRYRFKDFSSGKGGDGLELLVEMSRSGLLQGEPVHNRSQAASRVMQDYEEYISRNPAEVTREYVEHFKYRVHSWEVRPWNTIDQEFWTQFRIGSNLLEKYCVKPLESFTMRKQLAEGGFNEVAMTRRMIYGYFRMDGTLHKIYQPGNGEHKFIKVESYIQGSEQLSYKQPLLIITKALKDIMSLSRLNLPAESVAPDSENSMLPAYMLQSYLNRYEKVCTMFDNDSAGIKAMKRYEQEYGIPYLHLKAEKDPSDTVKAHGLEKTRGWIIDLMKEKLNYQ